MFVDPDEKYIIYAIDERKFTKKGKYKEGIRYLVISKRIDNDWSKPIKLNENINEKGARFPSVSPDGKILFFTKYTCGNNEDFYWIPMKKIK